MIRPAALTRMLLCGLAAAAVVATPVAATQIDLELADPLAQAPVRLQSGSELLHVVFFAVWCPPCVTELTQLAEIEARWEQSGYRLVLIAVPERQSAERLRRFVQDREPPGELMLDSDGLARSTLRGDGLPTHLLFDAEGVELMRADSLDGLEAEVERRLLGNAGRAPSRP